MNDKPLSFAIGDVVKLPLHKIITSPAFEDQPEEGYEVGYPDSVFQVITDIHVSGDFIEYGVNGSCWYTFKQIVFVSRATAESMAAFQECVQSEDDEEVDPEDEDEEFSVRGDEE